MAALDSAKQLVSTDRREFLHLLVGGGDPLGDTSRGAARLIKALWMGSQEAVAALYVC